MNFHRNFETLSKKIDRLDPASIFNQDREPEYRTLDFFSSISIYEIGVADIMIIVVRDVITMRYLAILQ